MQSIASIQSISSIQSVDTLTTIILLLILTTVILSLSLGILWYRYNQLKSILSEHIQYVNESIKQIEDMIS